MKEAKKEGDSEGSCNGKIASDKQGERYVMGYATKTN
jgi:hypothetical protein